jgi:Telomere resolvase
MTTTDLDRAATHVKTTWLKDFISEYFPKLDNAQISIEDFAAAVDRLLTDRALHDLKQQKNPRSNIVQALKSIDPNHPAIPLVSLTTDEYRDLNQAQQLKLSSRETRFITQTIPLVDRATELLNSAEWSDIAAGLAFLIGRRIGEIMLSKFSLNTPWSLNFSEMSKKAIEHQITIEIPTLAPAAIVLKAIDKLKHTLSIDDLQLDSLTPTVAKKKVSDRYSQAVAEKCDRHYQDLLPVRSDRESLYTHVFRAAYAVISIHWYCPPHVPDYAFRAEILGHYTIGSNGEKLPDYKAGANYADYAIGSTDGNRDGRLGIKLGTFDDLQVLAAFNPQRLAPSDSNRLAKSTMDHSPTIVDPTPDLFDESKSELEPLDLPPSPSEIMTSPIKRPKLSAADIDRMVDFWSRLDINGSTSDLFHQTIEHLWSVVPDRQPSEPTTDADDRVEIDFHEDLRWLVDEVKSLRTNDENFSRSIADLHQIITTLKSDLLGQIIASGQQRSGSAPVVTNLDDRDAIITQQEQQLSTLQQENDRLTLELADMKSKFDTIAAVFGGVPSAPVNTHAAPASPEPPSVPRPPVADSKVTKHSAKYERSLQMVDRVVSAAIAWNDRQDRSDRRLLLSLSGLKPLCLLLGAASQPAIQEVLSRRADELATHHSKFALGQRHNASIDLSEILRSIARDELHLPNWDTVKVA